jgi:glycosyltransferase involved in cell wall biosynthesis
MRADANGVRDVVLAIPGSIETRTGGYIYDRRILAELNTFGWKTATLALDSSFPAPTGSALADAAGRFAALDDGILVIIDGLALAGLVPLLPAIAARLKPVALIHHPLTDETGIDPDRAIQLKHAETAALDLVSQVIVTSPWTRRRLAEFGVEANKIAVIEPGVDRGPSVVRKPAAALRLLTVASITPRKGHSLLIDALARLKDYHWSLRCAGSLDLDPDCVTQLKAQIEQAGLADRVSLLGELSPDAIRREYASADLFVLPSYLEGYGMAFAEAIVHGLPVVATTAGAIPDTVPAAAARLVPPGDLDALTDALAGLMRDPAAHADLVHGAGTAAATMSSWADAGGKFAAVLEAFASR